jgi:tRNA dimethylallyltransferase
MFQASRKGGAVDGRELNSLVLGIEYERPVRRNRITERLKLRLKNGLVEEVEGLLNQGISAEKMDYYGLEYRFVTRYILNEYTYDEMFGRLNTAIHQFAKRQMTYFHGMERRGVKIHWLKGQLSMEEKLVIALELFQAACNVERNST